MKQRKGVKPPEPKVGVIYLVKGKLLIDSTPLSKAVRHGDHLIHDGNHMIFGHISPARVSCLMTSTKSILAGAWLLTRRLDCTRCLRTAASWAKKSLVARILSRMNLPPGDTESGTDSHYRCFRCLRRGS